MTRKQLPNRRPNVTVETHWQGHAISVTVGFHPKHGTAMEVFADTQSGGQMQCAVRDGCILASVALQHGATPAELAKSMSRVPDYTGTERAASPLGVIAQVVAEVDA